MGFFYNLLYKNDVFYTRDDPDVVRVALPGGVVRSPQGYGALMSVDYAACVQTKARSMASLPATVVVERRSGRENLTRHPLAKLLNGMANEEMSIAALMAWTVLRRDTFGNAYWWVEWAKGKPVALWPITASVTHDYKPNNPPGYRTRYTVAPGDDHVPAGTYFSNEVVNIHTAITKDGIKGYSLAKLAAEEIGLSVDLERFYRSMMDNSNFHLGHVETPDKLSPQQVDNIKTALKDKAGAGKAGEPPIFTAGAKWVTDQQTMRDASLIEQQKWVLHQVCRALNVPPWKVYDSEGTSYAGSQQSSIDYVTDTIVPDVRLIELALQPVLDACGLRNAQVKFKIQGLMRGDDASRSQFYREMAYMGAFTRADIRDFEDMEPMEGMDRPLFPLNYGVVEPDGSVTVFNASNDQKPKEPADGSQTGMEE